jgi:hypothetical protein
MGDEISMTQQLANKEYALGLLPKLTTNFRKAVTDLENEWRHLPQIELPLKHTFAPGAVAREMFLPADSFVIGKIHKFAHLNIISQGDVSVVTEFGMERYVAPCTFLSKPLTKRALYTHSDTIWTVVHVTAETDLQKLEEEVIYSSYDDPSLIEYEESLKQEATNAPIFIQ